jgi:hypothetical protein
MRTVSRPGFRVDEVPAVWNVHFFKPVQKTANHNSLQMMVCGEQK